MTESKTLPSILTEIAQDVASKGDSQVAARAFKAYKRCLESLVEPYVGDGFLDEDKALPRFFSETATLHMAVSLISQWCATHEHQVGRTGGFWDIHEESRFFSWYRTPPDLSAQIRNWVTVHPDIDDMLQAVTLTAEDSLAGLRRHSLGEFFTPTTIAQHLVDLVDYGPRITLDEKVVDPACGSGNLLAAVVGRTAQAVHSGILDPLQAISALNSNTFGFDVQPVAVLLTRLQLLLASLPIWEHSELPGKNVYETLSFPGIRLRDPLSDPDDLWDLFARFDVVVSNPPFLKVTKSRLPFVEKYEKVLYGHVNLYQLFLWWAIRATRPDGRLVFLVPQSIRSGQYSSRLRQEITDACDVVAVTSFVDRTGVFDCVEQPMMAIALKKPAAESQKPDVKVRISANGQTLGEIPALTIGQEQVVWTQDGVSTWCVSNERMDYEILAKVFGEHTTLGEMEDFRILNGGLVWNQHTERLKPTGDEDALPLISSASIGVHRFIFPPSDKRVSKRLFVDATSPLPGPVYENTSILLKRTTPKIMRGRRIVATMLLNDFVERYGGYFAENHVNVIVPQQDDATSRQLLGLCAWLNSRLANFAFGMINVSSHLSKFDLSLIPVPISLLTELSSLAERLADNLPDEQIKETLERIDEKVFVFFGLSSKESQRVRQVVPSAG
jgi:adenine-specific DNA-methyltransferase